MAEVINPAIVPKVTLPSGEQVPCVGMGTFGSDRVSAEDVSAAVAGAIRSGYRMFDCAACYGNEHEIGQVFKEAFDEGVVERKDLFIMTKVWNDMHRRVEEACDKSIKDLQCDYVDMYFIHWPFPNYHAPGCDVDSRNPDSKPFSVEEFMDTYRQCEALVEKGKIRYIGISNMTIPKLEAVLPLMKIKPATCELELHVCFQQQELYDYLVAHDIQPVGYMPIGSPMRPERDMCPEDVADLQTPVMQEIAKAHNCHPAIIALKWARQRGEIAIPFSLHNYVSNLKAMTEDPLTEEEMASLGFVKTDVLVDFEVGDMITVISGASCKEFVVPFITFRIGSYTSVSHMCSYFPVILEIMPYGNIGGNIREVFGSKGGIDRSAPLR